MASDVAKTDSGDNIDLSLSAEELELDAMELGQMPSVPDSAIAMRDKLLELKSHCITTQKALIAERKRIDAALKEQTQHYKKLHARHKGVIAMIRAIEDSHLQ